MAKLVVTNVSKSYPTRSEPLVVLRNVTLSLSSGENMAVVGPSGCGKSTLLQILGTLDTPTGGTVLLDGVEPFSLDEPRLAEFRHRQVGFVFQDHLLLPQCSVLENVLVPTLAEASPPRDSLDRARMLLDRVGLSARLDHRPAELSGGERQRAAIARALINRPALLLADEPTGNLDRATAQDVTRLLLELQQAEQTMLIVVTHSSELSSSLQKRYEFQEGELVAA